jgi:hypothetical protein
MVLPTALDPDFLKLVKAFHEQLAHTGVKSLMEKLQAAGHNHALLQQHVQFVCEHCGMCQKNSAYRAADQVANQRVIRITEVGEEWSLDVVGPLPADEDGNCYILAAGEKNHGMRIFLSDRGRRCAVDLRQECAVSRIA